MNWGGCLNHYNCTSLLLLLLLLFQGRKATGLVVHKHRDARVWHSSGVHVGLLQLHARTLSSCCCELRFLVSFFFCFLTSLILQQYFHIKP